MVFLRRAQSERWVSGCELRDAGYEMGDAGIDVFVVRLVVSTSNRIDWGSRVRKDTVDCNANGSRFVRVLAAAAKPGIRTTVYSLSRTLISSPIPIGKDWAAFPPLIAISRKPPDPR